MPIYSTRKTNQPVLKPHPQNKQINSQGQNKQKANQTTIQLRSPPFFVMTVRDSLAMRACMYEKKKEVNSSNAKYS